MNRLKLTRLDLAVLMMLATWVVMVAGITGDWWRDWWHASGDFRLPLLLIAAGSSVTGGIAAAFTYERLRAHSETRRWRPVEYAASSYLVGTALSLAQAIANLARSDGIDAPTTVETADDMNAVRDVYMQHQEVLVLNEALAERLAVFAERAFTLVSRTPGLRDDPDLLRETIQAAQSLPSWPATIRRVLTTEEPTARQRRNLSAFRDTAWQFLEICFVRGHEHLDPAIEEAAYGQYVERKAQAEGTAPVDSGESDASPTS